jgi:Transcriptional regulators
MISAKEDLLPAIGCSENELAERLCVSRRPFREALGQLASDGLVVDIPHEGVFAQRRLPARDLEDIVDPARPAGGLRPSVSCSTT